MPNNSANTSNQEIKTTSTCSVEKNNYLPDLDQGPSLDKMVDQLSLISQGLSEITDWDFRAAIAMADMVRDIQRQVEKFGDYRRVVEESLLPTHKLLQETGTEGQFIIHTLARIDQD